MPGCARFRQFLLGAPEQEKNNRDLYERNPYMSNLVIAAPPSIAMFCNGLMITVDGIVVGQMAGSKDLAALSYASGFDPLVKTFGNFVAVGAPQIISEALGRGDIDMAEKCLGLSFFINVLLTVLVMVLLIPLAPAFMTLAGASGELHEKALRYAYPLCIGAVFFILQRALCGCILAEGRANLSCALTILCTIINTAFGPLLIGVFNMQIAGAATASVIACGIGTIAALACYVGGATTCRIRIRNVIPRTKDDWRVCWQIIYVGLGDFIGNIANAFVSIVISRVSSDILRKNPKYTDADFLAAVSAQSAMFRIWNLINETMQGVSSQGLIPLVSFAYGRRDGKRMWDVLRANAVITFCLGLVFFLIVEAGADKLVLIFDNDAGYLEYAPTVLRIGLACVPILSPQFYMVSYAQAVGDGCSSSILSLVCYGLFVPAFFITLGLTTQDIINADIALPLNDVCSDILCFAIITPKVVRFYKTLHPPVLAPGEVPPMPRVSLAPARASFTGARITFDKGPERIPEVELGPIESKADAAPINPLEVDIVVQNPDFNMRDSDSSSEQQISQGSVNINDNDFRNSNN